MQNVIAGSSGSRHLDERPTHYDHRTSSRYPLQKPIAGLLARVRSMQLHRTTLGLAQSPSVGDLPCQRKSHPPRRPRVPTGRKTAQPRGMHPRGSDQVAVSKTAALQLSGIVQKLPAAMRAFLCAPQAFRERAPDRALFCVIKLSQHTASIGMSRAYTVFPPHLSMTTRQQHKIISKN